MKKSLIQLFIVYAIIILAMSLSACSYMPSMDSLTFHQNNNQQPAATQKTRASSYLYFNQLESTQKTAYIKTINSSSSDDFDIKPYITLAIQKKGYKVVENLSQANIVIRANLVRIGNFDNDQTTDIRRSEFGNSAPKIALTTPEDTEEALNYGVIIDLQAYERSTPITPNSDETKETNSQRTEQEQLFIYSNTMDWDRFQTRIITQELNTTLPQEKVFESLGNQVEQALFDIIKD